ncbi:malto-oligosyltrehalose trehalohydrolase [Herbiconiux sp. VKM Ac-2851]|uniref:malto-oligosyltrehalose trehalohydrolase n=1 Tax=Herbiconiux sp. VKM Ac-2851 TaxID=2739025 RepID=UPI0015645436|nr:malto-oligosyltrehalose trehalohydrolase [Herbiconiux sp. VKM Ac-2851]NQX36604.1 malto-oligosyltrehalose trehalohydrolase [Herbiconiux sp. VKM Ac-2851]
MTENDYRVWAPRATKVELVLADGNKRAAHPMTVDGDGWWSPADEAEWMPGVDYGYLLDGEGPYPDPRSRRQPEGVHGLSRTDDPSSFEWHDGDWTGLPIDSAEIYELHVGTFTPEGTLAAASAPDKLEHLRSIGVTHIELLPVNGFNGTHNWGYDGVAWFTVHEGYGGPDAYRRFVDACHAAGLAVIQDVVYNHLGPSGNYLPLYGPYLSDAHKNTWGVSVNLDQEGSAEVRRFILDNAQMWLRDYHVDGLRLDAVHALVDDSPTHLLAELAAEADALSASTGVKRLVVAESDLNDPVMFLPRDGDPRAADAQGTGYGLDGQWSDDFHHAVHVNLTGETAGYYADFDSVGALAKVLTRGFFHDGTYSSFREKEHGVQLDRATTAPWRLVVASQNHDQIGNRATGDRITATLEPDRLAIAAALTLLGPFTPMLFMGEEWGASTPWQFFTSHPEPDLGEATAKGRIEEFSKHGWDPSIVPDPQDPATFENSKLDWSELGEPSHAGVLEVYRRLAAIRRTLPAGSSLTLADVNVEFDEEARWLVLSRPSIVVIVNLGDARLDAGTVAQVAPLAGDVLFDSHAVLHGPSATTPDEAAGRPAGVAPRSVVVARQK